MHSRGIIGAAALLSLVASVSAQDAVIGFNYGNMKEGKTLKTKEDYLVDFKNAQKLPGTNGKFTSARLYTNRQGETTDPNEAIEAAIETKTSLLLGMWCSAGSEVFDKEVEALKNSIDKYGDDFTSLVIGISVGSEDLYRISEVGIKNKSPVGAGPDIIVDYIGKTREAIKDTPLANAKIGHVDTADTWVNGSNAAVVDAVDWIGVDAYPYFEGERENSIDNSANLFFQGINKTEKAAGGKPIWITETGWPITGKDNRLALPGAESAREFWVQVGCRVFGRINTWWYILEEDGATPNFGVSAKGSTKPFYDLSCENVEIDYSAGSSSDNSTSSGNSTDSDSTGSGTSGGSSSSSTSSGSEPSTSKTSGASYIKSFGVTAMMLAAAGVAAFLV